MGVISTIIEPDLNFFSNNKAKKIIKENSMPESESKPSNGLFKGSEGRQLDGQLINK